MQNHQKILNNKGITLVEIMIVVAIVAILGFMAGPELLSIGPKAKMKSAARDLKSNLEMAKMEAVKRNRSVYIVLVPGRCSGNYRSSGSYQIIVDMNNNRRLNDSDDIKLSLLGTKGTVGKKNAITTQYSFQPGTALCRAGSLPRRTKFRFNARGFWVNNNGTPQTGDKKFKISSRHKEGNKHPSYEINVSSSGYISVKYDS